MSDTSPRRPWLQPCYGLLVVCSSAAILQGLLLPRWPHAEALPKASITDGLESAGFRLRPLPDRPARRAHDLSTSAMLVWRLSTGDELRLLRGSVRNVHEFQAAVLARNQPSLTLQSRRLNDPQPGSARGWNRGQIAFQTCLVPGLEGPDAFGVSNTQLRDAWNRRPRSRADVASNLIGLPPSREISCVLISLSGSGGSVPEPSRWAKLLATLQPELQHESPRLPAQP